MHWKIFPNSETFSISEEYKWIYSEQLCGNQTISSDLYLDLRGVAHLTLSIETRFNWKYEDEEEQREIHWYPNWILEALLYLCNISVNVSFHTWLVFLYSFAHYDWNLTTENKQIMIITSLYYHKLRWCRQPAHHSLLGIYAETNHVSSKYPRRKAGTAAFVSAIHIKEQLIEIGKQIC